MRTHFEHDPQLSNQRLADLKNKTAELEHQLSDARSSLERELAQGAHQAPSGYDAQPAYEAQGGYETRADAGEERTDALVSHGRRGATYRRLPRGRLAVLAAAGAGGLVLVIVLAIILSGGGAAWPSSVATVQNQIVQACQNPNVKSEPGQVNFACAKNSRQILWVFALLTSNDNPRFGDAATGRAGLEPISPRQGGEVAWSLNLHHPYSPTNPVDSLEVAARAINNIIGGATLTGTNGNPVVQPGLESVAANCVRYTGSAALTAHPGFPSVCARPVASQAGQAALVADVYQKWIVGATPAAAQDAALLFENAQNPGDPRVQLILQQLSGANPTA